ncbi:MAG: c-type cytochrome [Kiloniellaceae bacterium]
MSSFEINKIIGAILTAGIIATTTGLIAGALYEPEELEENVYKVAVAEAAPAAEARAAPGSQIEPILPLLAAADPAAGQKATRKCATCHSFDQGGGHKIGPNLWNIVNRPVGGVDAFKYSAALKDKSGEVWSYRNLDAFLAKPKDWAPGTKMTFGGIKDAGQRADLIAYLRSLSDSPAALPE